MKGKQQLLDTERRSYQAPQVLDSGSVVLMTLNNVAPEDWERHADNVVWGNLFIEEEGDEEQS